MPVARRYLLDLHTYRHDALAGLPFPMCAVCKKWVDDWEQWRGWGEDPHWHFIAKCHGEQQDIVVYDRELEDQEVFELGDTFTQAGSSFRLTR